MGMRATLLICLLAVVACSSPPAEESAQPVEGVEHPEIEAVVETETEDSSPVQAWDCEDGTYLVTEFRPTAHEAVVFLPGETVTLPHVRSASGAHYASESIEVWNKGDELTVKRTDEDPVLCSRNVRASQLEASKLAGNDYWAIGNEPGWVLEIGPEEIVWATDYRQTIHRIPTPRPDVDENARGTVYRAELDGKPFLVTITGAGCSDDMSGERFPTSFLIEHGIRMYRGCGQALAAMGSEQ
jgi:putative lipoprotein